MRITASRVQTLGKRADAAALAAQVRREKARPPITDKVRADAAMTIVDVAQAAGGRPLALLERISTLLRAGSVVDGLSLLCGLRFDTLFDDIERVLDGSGTMAAYRAALHPLVAQERVGV